jgi:hypothetical protein
MPLYQRGKSPRYSLDRRLGGSQRRSGRCGEEKSLDPAGIRTAAGQPVAIPTELSRPNIVYPEKNIQKFEKRMVTEIRSSEKDDTRRKLGMLRNELLLLHGGFTDLAYVGSLLEVFLTAFAKWEVRFTWDPIRYCLSASRDTLSVNGILGKTVEDHREDTFYIMIFFYVL